MQRLVAGDLSVEDGRGPLDRCLGCRACEVACPSEVQYGEMLEIVRDGGAQTPSIQVRALLAFVRRPRVLSLALRAGRPLARFVPGRRGTQREVARLPHGGDLGATPAGRPACRRAARMRHARGVPRRPAGRRGLARGRRLRRDRRARAGLLRCAAPPQRRARDGRGDAAGVARGRARGRDPRLDRGRLRRRAARARRARARSQRGARGRRPRRPRAAAAGLWPCSTPATSCTPSACARRRASCCAAPATSRSSSPAPGAAAAPPVCTRSHSPSCHSSWRRAASTPSARAARSVVSCGNPGCAMQLRSALREAHLDVRVAHPAELAAEADPRC